MTSRRFRIGRRGTAGILLTLGIVVSACGGGDAAPATTLPSAEPTSTTVDDAPATTTGDGSTSTTAGGTATTDAPPVTRPEPDPDRQLAPDFTLELGDGGEFVLSQEVRPVFMVFWAEW